MISKVMITAIKLIVLYINIDYAYSALFPSLAFSKWEVTPVLNTAGLLSEGKDKVKNTPGISFFLAVKRIDSAHSLLDKASHASKCDGDGQRVYTPLARGNIIWRVLQKELSNGGERYIVKSNTIYYNID